MIKDGWIYCPRCKKKLFPIDEGTTLCNLRWRCKRCKEEFTINPTPAAESVLIEDLPMEQQQERTYIASIRDGFDSEQSAYHAHAWESF